jgi:hypothetical protein
MLCGLSSCVMEKLHDTNHPEEGKIVSLATDWTARGEGIPVPATCTARVGEYTADIPTGAPVAIDPLLAPGTYPVNVYNTADKITVTGTTATVATADGTADPLPGWFFTAALEARVEKDRDHALVAVMRQQTRQLTLALEITGDAAHRVQGITARLSGVAAAIDINSGLPVGDPVGVAPLFEREPDGIHCAVTRLLGITGQYPALTVTLDFDGGTPPAVTVSRDLAAELAGFNSDKRTPLALRALLLVTPAAGGFSATISEWTTDTGNAIAD